MRGKVCLHSLKGDIIICGEYKNKYERRMIMSIWTGRFHPIGYYFVITPLLDEDVKANKYVPVSRLVKKESPVYEDKKVELIRPAAIYDNKTPFGILESLHNDKSNDIKKPHKKKKVRRLKSYEP